jgi:NAD(P)-dependent dehydrogenase (short-subunit alcohol dehydrogenase family)
MKTILITGGTDGIGKALAMHFLHKGNKVIVVGSSVTKGKAFLEEANHPNAVFIQADLSLIKENQRLIAEVQKLTYSLDMLILCAQLQTFTKIRKQTIENFEFVFALYYLSRYVLSYGFKDLLEKSDSPVIMNVCGTGMPGKIKWDDLQISKNYNSLKTILHGSRLNDLAGVAFALKNQAKIKYILYNPGGVQTNGATEAFTNPVIRTIIKSLYKILCTPVNKAIIPLIELLTDPPLQFLSAYKKHKQLSLSSEIYDKQNAERLYELTKELTLHTASAAI